MDYKYIEQLLEKYWNCETSLEEEEMLRVFFSQDELPVHLARYRSLFRYEHQLVKTQLGDDFDARMLQMVQQQEKKVVKAKSVPFIQRIRPLMKAAAVVALLLTLGNAAQNAFVREQAQQEYNYENYQDSYKDPQVAYEQMSQVFEMIESGINDTVMTDSSYQFMKSEQK